MSNCCSSVHSQSQGAWFAKYANSGLWEVLEWFWRWSKFNCSSPICKSWDASKWLLDPPLWWWGFDSTHCWPFGSWGLSTLLIFCSYFLNCKHMTQLLCQPCQAWSVPEVLRPLYESPGVLAQKMTTSVCCWMITFFLVQLKMSYTNTIHLFSSNFFLSCIIHCAFLSFHDLLLLR